MQEDEKPIHMTTKVASKIGLALAKVFGTKHEITEQDFINGGAWSMTYYRLGNRIYVTEYHDLEEDFHL